MNEFDPILYLGRVENEDLKTLDQINAVDEVEKAWYVFGPDHGWQIVIQFKEIDNFSAEEVFREKIKPFLIQSIGLLPRRPNP